MINSEPKTIHTQEIVLKTENVNVYYGDFLAVKNIYLDIPKNKVTAFIGPSGCVARVLYYAATIVSTI